MRSRISWQEKVLLYGSSLWYLGEGMLGPLFVVFAARIGGDILEISWAWATYLVVSGVSMLAVGAFSDSYNKKKIMVVGYGLNALCTFGYLFVSTASHLFIVQAGLGLASALATPTWDALFDRYSGNGKSDGHEWGLAEGAPNIITGVAVLIGGLLLTYTSFTTLFIAMGTMQVVATLVQASILRRG